ncbi:Na+/Pi symporter [Phlyctochytrium bullatum]|nr:Na+/Pi symporter [Phlyctochytrium bullatum]
MSATGVVLTLHSYTWIFALTMCFCFMDAYAIGANDVANSFATSVGSRTLFAGAIALGAETASTIRDGIIRSSNFSPRPDLLMTGFMALASTVNWGWEGKGVPQIVASWFASPLLAGIIAVIIFTLTRELILTSPNSFRRGIFAIPIYFTITTFIVIFYVATKNGKSMLKIEAKDNKMGNPLVMSGDVATAFAIIGSCTAVVFIFCYGYVVPYFIRRLEKEEKLKWYHLFCIHFVPTQPHDPDADIWLKRTLTAHLLHDHDATVLNVAEDVQEHEDGITPALEPRDVTVANTARTKEMEVKKEGFWTPAVEKVKCLAYNSVLMDVATVQRNSSAEKAQKVAVLYDNKTEFLYSFLQVVTASFASFGHGSNDVANAIGPTTGVFEIWSKGCTSSKAEIPKWLLAYSAFAMDAGLALYGYNVMKSLGNNLTYHSPTRGFSMELGAALAVITASFLGLPVSTTQCIVGATVCVGLCNGNIKSVNWRMFGISFFSWMLTLPVAGTLAGCLFALLTRGPSFTTPPQL